MSRGSLGEPLGGLEAVLGALGAILGDLGAILGDLGAVLGGLGPILGALGVLLGGLGTLLGRSWEVLGRSRIDQKIDPKLVSKTVEVATEKNGPNATPVVVSEVSAPHRESHWGTPENYQTRYRYD